MNLIWTKIPVQPFSSSDSHFQAEMSFVEHFWKSPRHGSRIWFSGSIQVFATSEKHNFSSFICSAQHTRFCESWGESVSQQSRQKVSRQSGATWVRTYLNISRVLKTSRCSDCPQMENNQEDQNGSHTCYINTGVHRKKDEYIYPCVCCPLGNFMPKRECVLNAHLNSF